MGSVHQVEVVVHVDERLDDIRRANLLTNLQSHDGVEKASFTLGRDHLMLVYYDSNKLHTTDVLDYVRQENVSAELIGI